MTRENDDFTDLLEDGGPTTRPISELLQNFDVKTFVRNRRLREGYDDAKTMGEKWGHIRQVWQEHMPAVMAAPADRWVSPYFVDWDFSRAGLRSSTHIAPLYPQVPVFNWFVDFGNPRRRIGLEVDGKEWHSPEKDRNRDLQLWGQDWRIF